MNSKKSIVLLITLFFISAISVLILQNLKDTEDFLDEISSQSSLSQVQITINNINTEIPKYLKSNSDNIDDILANAKAVPLQFGNVDILLSIEEYILPQFYINNLTDDMMAEDDFMNNINYQYDFLEIVKKNNKKKDKYKNNNQIQHTIQEYIKLTKDSDILNIKDEFTYIKEDENITLIQCDYSLSIDDKNCSVSFIFDLGTSKIKEFNILNIF